MHFLFLTLALFATPRPDAEPAAWIRRATDASIAIERLRKDGADRDFPCKFGIEAAFFLHLNANTAPHSRDDFADYYHLLLKDYGPNADGDVFADLVYAFPVSGGPPVARLDAMPKGWQVVWRDDDQGLIRLRSPSKCSFYFNRTRPFSSYGQMD